MSQHKYNDEACWVRLYVPQDTYLDLKQRDAPVRDAFELQCRDAIYAWKRLACGTWRIEARLEPSPGRQLCLTWRAPSLHAFLKDMCLSRGWKRHIGLRDIVAADSPHAVLLKARKVFPGGPARSAFPCSLF